MNLDMKIDCQREPWMNGIGFLLSSKGDYVTGMTITHTEPGEFLSLEPSFRLNMSESQKLMDELWACGIRPTEGHGSSGQIGAVEKHLADMRALVFKDKDYK